MKRILSIALAGALALSMAVTAFADQTYVVQKGDYLAKIAPKYNTTWNVLAKHNNLKDPNLIYPGQQLSIPDGTAAPAPAAAAPVVAVPAAEAAPVVETPATDGAVETGNVQLTGLTVLDIAYTGTAITPYFSPVIHDYTVRVQDDIYGVKVIPTAGPDATVTVNDEALAADGSYLLALPQGIEDYGKDISVTAVIKVYMGNEYSTYRVTVNRDNAKDVYALFTEHSYTDAETGVTLPYELYVPSNYNSSKKYPLVFVLHGAGQRNQPLFMLLARYQSATAWAKDSESGINQCIVVSPQVTGANGNGWTDFMKPYDQGIKAPAEVKAAVADPFALQPFGIAAHNLLHEIESQYSVDTSRVYATGLSMGGFGTYAMAVAYPEDFAAIAPVCGGLDPSKASVLADNHIAVYHTHAKDDGEVQFQFAQDSFDAMSAAGVNYVARVFEPGELFYPSAHFAWTPAYASKEMRNWLFAQHK